MAKEFWFIEIEGLRIYIVALPTTTHQIKSLILLYLVEKLFFVV